MNNPYFKVTVHDAEQSIESNRVEDPVEFVSRYVRRQLANVDFWISDSGLPIERIEIEKLSDEEFSETEA